MKKLIDQIKKLAGKRQKLQELLDTLSVNVQYLLFDLEATRREKDYLIKKLNSLL